MADKKVSPLLVIVGETASGKSSLAIDLAARLNGEIICADAWTLRREADIGTAKPSKHDQLKVKHHLLNIIEPCETFSAARFKLLAAEALEDVSSRNKLPILVGGNGLYIDSLLYDYSFLVASSKDERAALDALSLDQLINKAKKLSLDMSKVDLNNKRRLIRLIETSGSKPTKKLLRDNTLVIGIKLDRELLRTRISNRLEKMLKAGLEKEVLKLSRDYSWQCETLKAIGYKEWHQYFLGNISKKEVTSQIINNSLDLAKRQRTWFNKNKSIHWINTPVKYTQLVELITTKLT